MLRSKKNEILRFENKSLNIKGMNKGVVKRGRKTDFSLIEVLVALTIIAVSFSVYMRALSLNIKNTGVAKSYITASLLAKKKITELVLKDKEPDKNEKNKAKEGDFGDKYPGFLWQLKTKELSKYIDSNELIITFVRNGETRRLFFYTLTVNKKLKKTTEDSE